MIYVVAGPTIVNDICFENGKKISGVLGGSVYCVSGLLFWTADITYISKVGPDFSTFYGAWMQSNRVSDHSLIVNLPKTHYSVLQYHSSGRYTEASLYGEEYENYVYPLSRLTAGDIAQHCSVTTKGIYLEVYENESIWNQLGLIRRKTGAPILWEIPSDSVFEPSRRTLTLQRILQASAFSINIPEAAALFQTSARESLIRQIRALGRPCFLRAGAEGSYWVSEDGVFFAPSLSLGPPVDPTGCGNASTAAALYAYAEELPPAHIPVIGNISAAFTILQYGPFPVASECHRAKACSLLRDSLRKNQNGGKTE